MRQVIDASVVLAWLLAERGGDAIEADGGPYCLSSVNLAEVLTKSVDRGLAVGEVMRLMKRLPIEHHDYARDAAAVSAELRAATRAHGLSLGDRACLALGQRLQLPVLTADAAWAAFDIGIDVRLIR